MDRYPFDAGYLRRLRDGDAATVQHFVDYFTEKLTLKLWHRGRSRSEIDDAIQDTFARLFARLQSQKPIDSPESFGAFVFKICDNYLNEQGRYNSKLDQLDETCFDVPAPEPSVEQMLLSGERGEKALRTLKRMKPKEAEILRALFIDEHSKDEVCARYEITRTYLRVVLHRAIAHFRFLFQSEGR